MNRFVLLLSLLLVVACDGDTSGDPMPGVDGGDPPPAGDRSAPAAYVRGEYRSLVIELDTAGGLRPRAGVSETVIGAVTPLLDKPDGVRVETDTAIGDDQLRDEWTFDDVRALAAATFDGRGGADEAVLHTMWLPGRYAAEGGGTVLGVAWGNRHIAMFPETIEASCASLLPAVRERVCTEAEAAVWTHEIGHVIGLVNIGVPMVEDHEDPEHPGHTTDEDGVMYWASERAAAADLLAARLAGGGPVFEFGPASRADVEAFRSGP